MNIIATNNLNKNSSFDVYNVRLKIIVPLPSLSSQMRFTNEKIDIIIKQNDAGLFKSINSPNDTLKFYFTKPID